MKTILGSIIIIVAFGFSSIAQNTRSVFDKAYVESIEKSLKGTKDDSFIIFYKNANRINKIMGEGYVQKRLSFLISKEQLDSLLFAASKTKAEPNWDSLITVISDKHGKYYAGRVIVAAKVRWYSFVKNGPKYAKYTVINISKYEGTSDSFLLSNAAWDVFKNSTKKSELKAALRWSKAIIEREPRNAPVIDTYANLLYKMGNGEKALLFEEKALHLEPDNAEIKQNLEKMQSGLPTWPLSEDH